MEYLERAMHPAVSTGTAVVQGAAVVHEAGIVHSARHGLSAKQVWSTCSRKLGKMPLLFFRLTGRGPSVLKDEASVLVRAKHGVAHRACCTMYSVHRQCAARTNNGMYAL